MMILRTGDKRKLSGGPQPKSLSPRRPRNRLRRRSHLARARANGVTFDEMVETITHLAFYSGWPNAVTAIGVARELFEKK